MDGVLSVILENFDMSLGAGLAKLQDKAFRIGHLGSFNDLMLVGTLGGVEMGLRLAGVPHREVGVMAALERLCPPVKAPEKQNDRRMTRFPWTLVESRPRHLGHHALA